MRAQATRGRLLCAMLTLALCLCCFWGLAQAESQDLINVNKASVERLQELPGVGPVLAKRIVEYREEQEFEKKEDIMKVKGIGTSKFEDIKDLITTG
ncbi:MAG: ComEA family DNA-binding protein [Desulfohalobiaceae bacterium]